jgi:hypothetical protein
MESALEVAKEIGSKAPKVHRGVRVVIDGVKSVFFDISNIIATGLDL